MSKTTDHLEAAFAGESQAGRKYTAFAKKAEEEGYPQIAKLFRAAAMAESVHAINHFKAFGGVSSTSDNLQAAISGENYEVVSMYPPMIADAEAEGNKKGATSLKWAYEVEKVHEALYRYALEHMDPNAPVPEYYVCPICGYTHEGKFEGKCPVCGTPAEKFVAVA
jgi:rubrerythrin